MNITVLGAGTWGAALAQVVAENKHSVNIWDINQKLLKDLDQTRLHPNLPKFKLSESINIVYDIKDMPEPELILIVVPSQVVRVTMENYPNIPPGIPIVSASKGIENGTLCRMSEVIHNSRNIDNDRIAILSGPSHAEEVAKGLPTAVACASSNIQLARDLQKVFNANYFRVYANDDIAGVELCGAVKNVIAIAAGICDGIGFGDNTMAALITRGLAEMTRLGLALGARKETFAGLSGVGDLVVTANSTLSRNRFVGKKIGEGTKLSQILDEMNMVAEGVRTTQSIYDLSIKLDIEMPICKQVNEILFKDKDPRSAITELMTRELVDEHRD